MCPYFHATEKVKVVWHSQKRDIPKARVTLCISNGFYFLGVSLRTLEFMLHNIIALLKLRT